MSIEGHVQAIADYQDELRAALAVVDTVKASIRLCQKAIFAGERGLAAGAAVDERDPAFLARFPDEWSA